MMPPHNVVQKPRTGLFFIAVEQAEPNSLLKFPRSAGHLA